MTKNRPWFDDRYGGSHRDKNHDGRRNRHRRRRMDGDAQRAMVAVGFQRMDMRHLDDGKERKQYQA